MIKIRIFEGGIMNNNLYSSTHLKNAVMKCFNPNNLDIFYKDKPVYITDESDFTHAIILNTAMPVLKIPKQNVIGLAWEPTSFLDIRHDFINYAIKHIGKYYIGDKTNLPDPFIENYGFMTYDASIKEISQKTKKISIVFSSKQFAYGHKYRHTLVNCILRNKIPIDIYGRGCCLYSVKDDRLKGEFTTFEPYSDYYFTICIENFRSNHYFSEKIINPLLYNCRPIYLGCHNINKYLNDSPILLSGNLKDDMELIVRILLDPLTYYKKSNIPEINQSVNLLLNLDNLF